MRLRQENDSYDSKKGNDYEWEGEGEKERRNIAHTNSPQTATDTNWKAIEGRRRVHPLLSSFVLRMCIFHSSTFTPEHKVGREKRDRLSLRILSKSSDHHQCSPLEPVSKDSEDGNTADEPGERNKSSSWSPTAGREDTHSILSLTFSSRHHLLNQCVCIYVLLFFFPETPVMMCMYVCVKEWEAGNTAGSEWCCGEKFFSNRHPNSLDCESLLAKRLPSDAYVECCDSEQRRLAWKNFTPRDPHRDWDSNSFLAIDESLHKDNNSEGQQKCTTVRKKNLNEPTLCSLLQHDTLSLFRQETGNTCTHLLGSAYSELSLSSTHAFGGLREDMDFGREALLMKNMFLLCVPEFTFRQDLTQKPSPLYNLFVLLRVGK